MDTNQQEFRPVARAADTEADGSLRHALGRVTYQADRAEEQMLEFGKSLDDFARTLHSHLIRCEAGTASFSRDLRDMAEKMTVAHVAMAQKADAINIKIVRIILWGGAALAAVIAIELLGIERAYGIFKFIRSLG